MRGSVVSSFNDAALQYLAHADVQKEAALWLSEYIPKERRGAALELGAGPGLFTDYLLPWEGQLTVSDISPSMVSLGKKRYPKLNWEERDARLTYRCSYDFIFSSSMLQWIEDPLTCLTVLKDQLRPQGRLIMGLFIEGSLAELNALTQVPGPLPWKSEKTWVSLLEEAGYYLIRHSVKQSIHYFPTALACLKSIHATGAAPDRIFNPGKLRAILKSYDERYRTSSGVPVTWNFYRFEAIKT